MARKYQRPWKCNPVIVDWIDSTSTAGWVPEKDGMDCDQRCCSVGHLIAKDKDSVTLALNRSAYGHGDYIKIPSVAVKRIRKLKE